MPEDCLTKADSWLIRRSGCVRRFFRKRQVVRGTKEGWTTCPSLGAKADYVCFAHALLPRGETQDPLAADSLPKPRTLQRPLRVVPLTVVARKPAEGATCAEWGAEGGDPIRLPMRTSLLSELP